jgi:uncharacterized glyoxalase superfamily protein PhnB
MAMRKKKGRPVRSRRATARRPKTAGAKAASHATTAARIRAQLVASVEPIGAVTRRMPETLRLRAFSPSLTVDDIKRSMAFYTDVLGFIVSEYWTDDDGQVRGAMLKAGACELGLSQDDWKKGRERKKGEGVRLWCETAQDIDALAVRIKAAGVAITEGPKDHSWGARSLSLDDPNGYHLTIARYA